MANYNETILSNVEIKKWQRARNINIINQYQKSPVISFLEEIMTTLPNGEKFSKPLLAPLKIIYNTAATFNLLNPETNEVIGTMTHEQLFVALYSLYTKAAIDRDGQ